MPVRIRPLHEALEGFLVNLLRLIGERVKAGQLSIPEQLVARVEFRDGGLWHDVQTIRDYVGLVTKALSDSGGELNLDKLLATLLVIPELNDFLQIGSGGAEPTVMNLRISLLMPVVARYYSESSPPKEQQAFDFDEAAFTKTYESLEEYLLGTEDTYRLVAPLLNFEMGGGSLTLGSVTIRALDNDEVVQLNRILPDHRSIEGRFPFGIARFGVETLAHCPRGSQVGVSAGFDRLWWSVICLKLAKKGAITYGDVWIIPHRWSPFPGLARQSRSVQLSFFDIYRMAREDIPVIERIWHSVEGHVEKPPPFWMVALGRFDDSSLRHRPEDKLIDTWIGLEALFGKGVGVGELRYQLSLRLAHFLETDAGARKRVRDLAMDAYKLRGAVVHGEAKRDVKKLSELPNEMEMLLRRALCKCVLNGIVSQKELVSEVEASIIGEAARRVE